MTEFEAVIGLEVHTQLSTETKIFCGCLARVEGGVNANTCPVCAGHPGTLPVLNRKVLEYAVRAGLATGCRINLKNVFARKNYFYPDLPKGYQISQYESPICENGELTIQLKTGSKKVTIQRIHMEEDAGKNVHLSGFSLINLNRAGVPLVEIVSGPDMSSSEEAGAYLRSLHAVVTYLGICDGNMEKGNFRCDANVSVRPKGMEKLGTRAEIKNVNSFRFVEKAIEYEIARQIEVVKAGGRVVQETRLYDSDRNVTVSMRSKEEAHDYRYFPDPDLITVHLDQKWVDEIQAALPELPDQKKARLVAEFGLSAYDAGVLTANQELAGFFDTTVGLLEGDSKVNGKPVANFLTGEVARLLNDEGIELRQSKLLPGHVADVVRLTQSGEISSTAAKQVIVTAWKTGDSVATIVDRDGLKQVSDLGALEPIIEKVIAMHPTQVADFKSGKGKLLGFFVGQVMKETGGKANPGMLQDVIRKKLES